MFNDDQRDWMEHLSTLPREAKCDCGWSARGKCLGPCRGQSGKGGAPTRNQRVAQLVADGKTLCPKCKGFGWIEHSLGSGCSSEPCSCCRCSGEAPNGA